LQIRIDQLSEAKMFTHAITRIPGESFARGLTTKDIGKPDYQKTLAQHKAYRQALQSCELDVFPLEAAAEFPDSTFVEDTAVLIRDCAILTRPGATSRAGEVARMKPVLEKYYTNFESITEPGTMDGGDICEAGNHFFIGVSERTNEVGARQFAEIVGHYGYSSDLIDICGMSDILHLKSGIAYLSDGDLVVINSLAAHTAFQGFNHIRVPLQENYAANCILVNGTVLIPAGFEALADSIVKAGYSILSLEMSEFEKMDGGLSCLSLRF
jgi:dimethylargininase